MQSETLLGFGLGSMACMVSLYFDSTPQPSPMLLFTLVTGGMVLIESIFQ